jgi:hypothetical protein
MRFQNRGLIRVQRAVNVSPQALKIQMLYSFPVKSFFEREKFLIFMTGGGEPSTALGAMGHMLI